MERRMKRSMERRSFLHTKNESNNQFNRGIMGTSLVMASKSRKYMCKSEDPLFSGMVGRLQFCSASFGTLCSTLCSTPTPCSTLSSTPSPLSCRKEKQYSPFSFRKEKLGFKKGEAYLINKYALALMIIF